nr:MAG TPA: hypothetical protein [Caudoviricetes sp.]
MILSEEQEERKVLPFCLFFFFFILLPPLLFQLIHSLPPFLPALPIRHWQEFLYRWLHNYCLLPLLSKVLLLRHRSVFL